LFTPEPPQKDSIVCQPSWIPEFLQQHFDGSMLALSQSNPESGFFGWFAP
jgi:hypothetical protein